MAYTLAGLRQRIRDDKLDDPEFDGGVIDRFLNDTVRYIYNTYELPFMEKSFSGSLPVGENAFVFPNDLLTPQLMVLSSEDGTQVSDLTNNYAPFRDFFMRYPLPENNQAGRPTIWTSHGNRMYVERPSDQVYILKTFYIRQPNAMSDDADIPDVPQNYEEALLLGALYRIHQRNEDFDLAAAVKAEFTEQVDLINAKVAGRQVGKANTMRLPLHSAIRRRR